MYIDLLEEYREYCTPTIYYIYNISKVSLRVFKIFLILRALSVDAGMEPADSKVWSSSNLTQFLSIIIKRNLKLNFIINSYQYNNNNL